jgi:hypothetical protein
MIGDPRALMKFDCIVMFLLSLPHYPPARMAITKTITKVQPGAEPGDDTARWKGPSSGCWNPRWSDLNKVFASIRSAKTNHLVKEFAVCVHVGVARDLPPWTIVSGGSGAHGFLHRPARE